MTDDTLEDLRLTDRELSFCHLYVSSGNGAGAARDAGYSPNGASSAARRLLIKPSVRQAVNRLKRKRLEATEISAVNVVNRLSEAAERAMAMKDHANAIRALTVLLGHLTDTKVPEAKPDTAASPNDDRAIRDESVSKVLSLAQALKSRRTPPSPASS